MDDQKIPLHIAIIMDGNGRWARSKTLPLKLGHKKGAEAAKITITAAIKRGIRYLTLYAFSSENWQRPVNEINDLMSLLKYYLRMEINNLQKQNIKLKIIGDHNLLAPDIKEEIDKAEKLTSNNSGLHLNIAFSYGSRQEIIEATKNIAYDLKANKVKLEEISDEVFSNYLYTKNIPDPDLLIRTSGEQRISNFLLWQAAYAELFFTQTLWPDFNENDLNDAINAYQLRKRRYGKR
ncbi:MAG: isoprenyl transferase [Alphaproteobacteria bacterium]